MGSPLSLAAIGLVLIVCGFIAAFTVVGAVMIYAGASLLASAPVLWLTRAWLSALVGLTAFSASIGYMVFVYPGLA